MKALDDGFSSESGSICADRPLAAARNVRQPQPAVTAIGAQPSDLSASLTTWLRVMPCTRRRESWRPWRVHPVRAAAMPYLVVVLLALASASFAAADVPNATYVNSPLVGTALDRA